MDTQYIFTENNQKVLSASYIFRVNTFFTACANSYFGAKYNSTPGIADEFEFDECKTNYYKKNLEFLSQNTMFIKVKQTTINDTDRFAQKFEPKYIYEITFDEKDVINQNILKLNEAHAMFDKFKASILTTPLKQTTQVEHLYYSYLYRLEKLIPILKSDTVCREDETHPNHFLFDEDMNIPGLILYNIRYCRIRPIRHLYPNEKWEENNIAETVDIRIDKNIIYKQNDKFAITKAHSMLDTFILKYGLDILK